MKSTSTLLIIALLACTIQFSKADLPIHCLQEQVAGKWKFQITEPKQLINLKEHSCGHQQPDDPQSSYLAFSNEFKKHTEFNAHLGDDNLAEVDGTKGKWTMVYDQAMSVDAGDHKFTAYFSYFPNEQEGDEVYTYCGGTIVGWYENSNSKEYSCFKAEKEVTEAEKKQLTQKSLDQISVVEPEHAASASFIQQQRPKFLMKQTPNHDPLELHRDFTEHHKFVDRLNNKVQKGWEAKHHEQFEGMTLAELNKYAGRKKYSTESSNLVQKQRKAAEDSDVSHLPKNFDWSDYLPEVAKSQGSCGSCYIFASMTMLEMRLKIHEKKDVKLSVQHVIDCSYQNQGCDGGYPFLVQKFGSEMELVPESCNSYHESNGECSTCDTTTLPELYKVKDYSFVGGTYGKSNEKNIMEEIHKNGPVVVSFEPGYDFMSYNGGVYSSSEADWVAKGEKRPIWEKVDHSVLCYGWGETDDGEKYWKILNSWGPSWGENGSFRMKRGVDESAVESMAETAMPEIVSNPNYKGHSN